VLATNNMHNLTNIKRTKSEMGLFSDYPHFYSMTREGVAKKILFATRTSENNDFIISNLKDTFCLYGPNFVGILRPNLLGTKFELYNNGMDQKLMKDLPKDFYPVARILQTIEYDSNFFAEKPRSFRTTIFEKRGNGSHKFENLPPKFNETRGCYTLNFFGRVGKPSARNF
jgi:hypothetical protein